MRRALLLLSLGACASESAIQSIEASCAFDEDCPLGQSCHLGQCLDLRPATLAGLDLEITPPATFPASTRTQLLEVSLDTEAELELALPAATVIDALQVLDPYGAPIAARVAIRGRDRIPSRELDTQILLDRGRTSRVKLLPGLYDVRVLPTDTSRVPGIEIRDFEVRSGALVPRRDLAVPAYYRTLSGEVTRRTSQQSKVPGVTVQAISIGAGLPSTRAVTDLDGRYSILLPETPDTSFLLTAQPLEHDGPTWSFSQVISFTTPEPRELAIPIEDVGGAQRGRLRLRVLGVGADGPAPIAGARVVLTASTGVEYRTLSVQATTDAAGYVPQTSLPAARYRARVVPPPESAFASREAELDLSALENDLSLDKQLELYLKTPVEGAVVSDSGQAVAGATVRFEPVAGAAGAVELQTDAEGRYRLSLEPGSYVVVVTPTSNSRYGEPLPSHVTTLEVPPQQLVSLLVSLPRGTLFGARVVGADGAPVAGATVEAFARAGGRAFSIGRALSGDDGRVSLLVPAGL